MLPPNYYSPDSSFWECGLGQEDEKEVPGGSVEREDAASAAELRMKNTQAPVSVARWSIGNFWRFGVKISVEMKKNREIRIFISVFCQLYFNYLHTILNSSPK